MANPIFSLFATSPVRPLQQHMSKVCECVAQLLPLFEAVIARDLDAVNRTQERIGKLEDEADDLKHELRLNLPRSIFLPVERRDVLEILTMQDNIANRAKDIAGLVRGREMELPEPITQRFIDFVKRCIDACEQARKAINELDELVESGFKGGEVDLVQRMIDELNVTEKDTDNIQIEIRSTLFAIENELPPVETMFLYRLIEWTGDVGDCAQRVGSRLQLLLAR